VGCCESKCSNIIGIEVKLKGRVRTQQISDYLNSRVLTEVWVVTGRVPRITGSGVPSQAGVLSPDDEGGFRVVRRGERLSPDVCALVFVNSSFTSLTVYSFCDLCCQKKVISLGSYYGSFRYGDASEQVRVLRELLESEGVLPSRCGGCRVVFMRRSRSGKSCYPVVVDFVG